MGGLMMRATRATKGGTSPAQVRIHSASRTTAAAPLARKPSRRPPRRASGRVHQRSGLRPRSVRPRRHLYSGSHRHRLWAAWEQLLPSGAAPSPWALGPLPRSERARRLRSVERSRPLRSDLQALSAQTHLRGTRPRRRPSAAVLARRRRSELEQPQALAPDQAQALAPRRLRPRRLGPRARSARTRQVWAPQARARAPARFSVEVRARARARRLVSLDSAKAASAPRQVAPPSRTTAEARLALGSAALVAADSAAREAADLAPQPPAVAGSPARRAASAQRPRTSSRRAEVLAQLPQVRHHQRSAAAAAVAAALSLECGQRGVSTSTEIRMRTLE
mmetsp:Transcript_5507/g.12581  ORF Transcript_5507/g.12581 Transcript_5507/m.12581 type:complete len:336 (+) Transcript_5507:360-1367(+)